jgi:hypothetical protein
MNAPNELKREWVVRVILSKDFSAPPSGHFFYALTTNRYWGILFVNQYDLLKTLICKGLPHDPKVPVHLTKECFLANNAHQ